MAKKIYDGKLSGNKCRGRLRLTFKNTVSNMLEESHVKSQNEEPPKGIDEQWTRRKRYAETVAFGVPFSLTTPLGIQREASLVFF